MTLTEVSGAGSVISNVVDYAKWVKSLIHQSGPLSGDVQRLMVSVKDLVCSFPTQYRLPSACHCCDGRYKHCLPSEVALACPGQSCPGGNQGHLGGGRRVRHHYWGLPAEHGSGREPGDHTHATRVPATPGNEHPLPAGPAGIGALPSTTPPSPALEGWHQKLSAQCWPQS